MSDSDNPQRDRLIAETLHSGWDEAGANAARRAARQARHRRRGRRAMLAGVAAAIAAVVVWQFVRPEPIVARPDAIAATTPPPVLEIISDDELLDLLRDQSVLAIRDAHGVREIVWLNEPDFGTAPN